MLNYQRVLVGGFKPFEKYESPWEGWQPIYEMENNIHVWNHQPVYYIPYANHGAGIFTYKTGCFLGQMLVNIPYMERYRKIHMKVYTIAYWRDEFPTMTSNKILNSRKDHIFIHIPHQI
jgi:hypothetical protein